jgi:bifunctional non-homologous end joining protein LigD
LQRGDAYLGCVPAPARVRTAAKSSRAPGSGLSALKRGDLQRSPGERGETVRVTNPGRVLYPQLGLTKLELVRFYAEIGPWILPHVQGRPLTLVRCAKGVSAADALRSQCQFMRHTPSWHAWVPELVPRVRIAEQEKLGEYLVIDSLPALLAIINGYIVELHTWNSTVDDLERPDRLVFDLDPAPDIGWRQVVAAALRLRARLRSVGLQSWVKTTGGKGLHVVVPVVPERSWDECFAFSRAFAEALARQAPDTFTVAFERARRAGKVLLDYKRNHRTSIAVAAFSTRARPNAPVSVPIAWRELRTLSRSDAFTVENLRARLRTLRVDPWAGYFRSRQRLLPAAPARGHRHRAAAKRRCDATHRHRAAAKRRCDATS